MNINQTHKFINETYDHLSYFDLYGNSVFLFIFLTFFVFVVFSYCKVMQTKEDIADDWINQRCKPQNILFAGFITKPEGKTAFQYTNENFQFCVQSILTNIAGTALQPFQYMIQSLTKIFSGFADSIQQTREVTNKLRNNIRTFAEDILGRILNVMIPIQKMMISLMDIFQKIQGTMTSGLYTMLGSYYTLQALMGAIMELIIKVLVALTIIIVGLWVTPFTWPAAASMTAVFLAISVPLSVVLYFMSEVLHIKTSGIPKLRCFDENTLMLMNNGQTNKIKDIQPGDILHNGHYVTAVVQVTSKDVQMYRLHNIVVSSSHLVYYKNRWIRVENHPDSVAIPYDKPYLYCLNTSNKRIHIGNDLFSDWDEIINDTFTLLTNKCRNIQCLEDIHKYLDDGFEPGLKIPLLYSGQKSIQEIAIGDVLANHGIVYGIVKINTSTLRNKKSNSHILYHLLTTNGTIMIDKNQCNDYNNILDKFII